MGRAVGLKGEVEVAVLSDAQDRFAPGAAVLRASDHSPLTIRTLRRQGERTIIGFEEISDRSAAESLSGAELVIDESLARSLDEGEYWDHDLIGCEVVTVDGERVGVVDDVLHQPANEVLVIGSHLVPLVRDIVRSVEPGRRITIEPIPGLLD